MHQFRCAECAIVEGKEGVIYNSSAYFEVRMLDK